MDMEGTYSLQNYFRDTWPRKCWKNAEFALLWMFLSDSGEEEWYFSVSWISSGIFNGHFTLSRFKTEPRSAPTSPSQLHFPTPINGSSSLPITRPQAVWLGSFSHASCPKGSKSCISAFTIHVDYTTSHRPCCHHQPQAGGWQTLPVKGQMINISGFAGHTAPVTASQFCCCHPDRMAVSQCLGLCGYWNLNFI